MVCPCLGVIAKHQLQPEAAGGTKKRPGAIQAVIQIRYCLFAVIIAMAAR